MFIFQMTLLRQLESEFGRTVSLRNVRMMLTRDASDWLQLVISCLEIEFYDFQSLCLVSSEKIGKKLDFSAE